MIVVSKYFILNIAPLFIQIYRVIFELRYHMMITVVYYIGDCIAKLSLNALNHWDSSLVI
ncbi:hypothetical protein lam_1029 [Candidatus Liberibacter americanus str. Sao Paulo]|uniref:Uncharacterized protein n=1 Tax=Candidatus Liberibacter americanus str. Sao Paulo TaxID=1261131 RepID=U6B6F0_9HYPH|nr:hypothetical protein lam_1029 [Candidatus Liberibacter americanus str. Sao Paulo]